MAKIVNSWNEWDPLNLVIVGRPEGTNMPAPEPAWWYDRPEGDYPLPTYGPFPQEMIDKANENIMEHSDDPKLFSASISVAKAIAPVLAVAGGKNDSERVAAGKRARAAKVINGGIDAA